MCNQDFRPRKSRPGPDVTRQFGVGPCAGAISASPGVFPRPVGCAGVDYLRRPAVAAAVRDTARLAVVADFLLADFAVRVVVATPVFTELAVC